jgi:hypothetical protein
MNVSEQVAKLESERDALQQQLAAARADVLKERLEYEAASQTFCETVDKLQRQNLELTTDLEIAREAVPQQAATIRRLSDELREALAQREGLSEEEARNIVADALAARSWPHNAIGFRENHPCKTPDRIVFDALAPYCRKQLVPLDFETLERWLESTGEGVVRSSALGRRLQALCREFGRTPQPDKLDRVEKNLSNSPYILCWGGDGFFDLRSEGKTVTVGDWEHVEKFLANWKPLPQPVPCPTCGHNK